MELFPHEIADDTEENRKRRKKAINTVMKAQYRQQTFKVLSREVGKGKKNSLKRLYIQDKEKNNYKQIIERNKIENEILQYNQKHYKQAYESKAYRDRIYEKLSDDRYRDKILKGELEKCDCDYEEVFKFLSLLKQRGDLERTNEYDEISELEWSKVVRKAKKRSASSVFSNRTYSVYKCALDCEEMTKILIKFYNTIIKKQIYPKRWLKVLDIILEKGKGPILGNLRTIQLIEADVQLMMRIFIGGRNDKNIINDERLSKYNYGSRRHYSIETAILEKRLMYDSALRTGKPTMHTISDLKACYDRQLPNIGCMVQEAVGVNRHAAKLIQNILPIMQHHVATDYGISTESYGSEVNKLGGTGQGNSVSGAICRDTSCLIFGHLEQQQLGAKIMIPSKNKEIQRVAIAFVDDTDFYSNGQKYNEDMQAIMKQYTELYEATGGKIQESKILYYCWQWRYENGRQYIQQKEVRLEVHNVEIKPIKVEEATRTLGVHISPAISWNSQFEVMRKKLDKSVTRFMNMDINAYQAAIYFNTYIITSVYFGCGIVKLSPKEEQELRRLYEAPMLMKLGFSRNFPRHTLYSRRSALGIGLMKPNTIIDMMKLKLYLGNKRKLGNTNEAVVAQEDMRNIEAGRNVKMGEDPHKRYWKETWIDEVSDLLWEREINLQSPKKNRFYESTNKTMMEYAMEYAQQMNCDKNIMYQINFVRMKKGIVFPFEVVGFDGDVRTACYSNINERSPIEWTMGKTIAEDISKKQIQIWDGFLRWLLCKRIRTIRDFKELKWRWTMSEDRKIVRIKNTTRCQYYKREEDEVGFTKTNETFETMEYTIGILGTTRKNRVIIYNEMKSRIDESDMSDEENDSFPVEIQEAIRNRRAVAASDASINERCMATHWIITTLDQNSVMEGGVESNTWGDGLISAGEAVGTLDLISTIVKKSRSITTGEVVIYIDNKTVVREILKDINKESDVTGEAGAIITQIRREIEDASIDIIVEYAKNKPRADKTFLQQPGAVLMSKCDAESKKKRQLVEQHGPVNRIKHKGIETPCWKNMILDKNVKILIRELDAKEHEKQTIMKLVPENWKWVDREARNCFGGGAGIGTIKCVNGYNHHGVRNAKINQGLCSDSCPRCGRKEDWEHVMLCEGINELKKEFIIEVEEKIKEEKVNDDEMQQVEWIMKDIKKYLYQEDEEYMTTQQVIGMKMLFKGWSVKNWVNVNVEPSLKMKKINKILVKCSVTFYSKAWKHRNNIMHNIEAYRQFVIQWHKNVIDLIEKSAKPDMRRYLRTYEINAEKCTNSYIRTWNMKAMAMYKKVQNEESRDIRLFFGRRI